MSMNYLHAWNVIAAGLNSPWSHSNIQIQKKDWFSLINSYYYKNCPGIALAELFSISVGGPGDWDIPVQPKSINISTIQVEGWWTPGQKSGLNRHWKRWKETTVEQAAHRVCYWQESTHVPKKLASVVMTMIIKTTTTNSHQKCKTRIQSWGNNQTWSLFSKMTGCPLWTHSPET